MLLIIMWAMALISTFNNITAISWRRFDGWRKQDHTGETNDLSEVTDELYRSLVSNPQL